MQSKNLQVDQWQAARRKWFYDPVLWFSYRMVEVAYLDAKDQGSRPSDEALLARDWIATSESLPPRVESDFVSFPECCERLCLNADVERMALLERIDAGGEFDSDEAWERLAVLELAELKDDVEAIFEAFRVVPALDQFNMLSMWEM
jgi:hypothetical protein